MNKSKKRKIIGRFEKYDGGVKEEERKNKKGNIVEKINDMMEGEKRRRTRKGRKNIKE
jgi:hypothetical protein